MPKPILKPIVLFGIKTVSFGILNFDFKIPKLICLPNKTLGFGTGFDTPVISSIIKAMKVNKYT